MTQTEFNRLVTPAVKHYADTVAFKFATFNSKDYVNVIVTTMDGYQSHRVGSTFTRKGIEQLRDELLKIAPVENDWNDYGQFVVSLVEGAEGYRPSATPFVHSSRSAAVNEARRLAQLHGGKFVVLRAVHEAFRPIPVPPPVTDRSL